MESKSVVKVIKHDMHHLGFDTIISIDCDGVVKVYGKWSIMNPSFRTLVNLSMLDKYEDLRDYINLNLVAREHSNFVLTIDSNKDDIELVISILTDHRKMDTSLLTYIANL